jgi:hypothetical protein
LFENDTKGGFMKKSFWLFLFVPLFFSGCGNIEWFPDNSAVFKNNSTTTIVNNVPTPGPPSLIKSFSPTAILAGTNSILTFTIINGTGTPARSGLGFTDTLPAGLTVVAPPASLCGGTVTSSGTAITFTGGSLVAGPANCTITATVTAAAGGTFSNTSTDISGLVGGLENVTTNQTLTVFATSVQDSSGVVTAENLSSAPAFADADTITYSTTVDITNSAAADKTVTVDYVAMDLNGLPIPSTASSATSTTVPSITGLVPTGPTTLGTNPAIPAADTKKIQFWRIVKVTVQ